MCLRSAGFWVAFSSVVTDQGTAVSLRIGADGRVVHMETRCCVWNVYVRSAKRGAGWREERKGGRVHRRVRHQSEGPITGLEGHATQLPPRAPPVSSPWLQTRAAASGELGAGWLGTGRLLPAAEWAEQAGPAEQPEDGSCRQGWRHTPPCRCSRAGHHTGGA